MTQYARPNPPIKIEPLIDESPSSWLLRICLKYHLPFNDLVKIYGLNELVNQPVNITADLMLLSIFLPEDSRLPYTIREKIDTFQWEKGRSKWLIEPNKNGSMRSNSYTRICPKCLREKGYYQLKWQLRIVECCVEHSIRLRENCSECKMPISSSFAGLKSQFLLENEAFYKCRKCWFDFRMMKSKLIKTESIEKQRMITKAYTEIPVNLKYLRYIQFSRTKL